MSSGDSMLDVYLYENDQLLEKFESILLICESANAFTEEQIAEIFRILHTIKGSSAMMNFEGVANLSHALEDLFDHMRAHPTSADDYPGISQLAFETLDLVRSEIEKIRAGSLPDGDVSATIERIRNYLGLLQRHGTAAHQAAVSGAACQSEASQAAGLPDLPD